MRMRQRQCRVVFEDRVAVPAELVARLAPGDAVQIGEPRAADGDCRVTATIEHCWLAPPSAITHLGGGTTFPSTTVHAHDMPMRPERAPAAGRASASQRAPRMSLPWYVELV